MDHSNSRRSLFAVGVALPLLLGVPALAGPFDAITEALDKANQAVDDVDRTQDETKRAARGARDIVRETEEDAKRVTGKSRDRGTSASTRDASATTRDAARRAPPPPSAKPEVSAAAPTQWQIDLGDGETMSVSQSQLEKMISGGLVTGSTPVYSDALGEWRAAGKVTTLRKLF